MGSVQPRSLANLIGVRRKGQDSLGRILRYRSVERFHESYSALSGSRGTEGVYLSAIEAACRYSSETPDELVTSLSKASEAKLMEFLQGFVNHLANKDKAPKTVQAYLSAVKGFLEVNDIDVPLLRRRVRKPRVYVRSADRAPTMEELRLVCAGADLETRALLLFLLSSGCRIGEALMVQRDDIEPKGQAHAIRIRPEIAKDRIGRYTFITGEAFEAVEAYLETHNSPRLFPLSKARAYHKLTSAFERTIVIRKSAGRRDIHPHSLRKFFFTTALKVLGRELAEALIGHKQYLDQAYRRLTLEEIATSYGRLEPFLVLFGQAQVNSTKTNQVIARAEEVEPLISQGYEFLGSLPDGRAVLRVRPS